MRTDFRLRSPLFESPTFVLMQAGRIAIEQATLAVKPFGLSLAEYATLLLVQRSGGISQSAVATRLGLSKTRISRLASPLERRGLLHRRQHLFNPASRALYITQEGLELIAEAREELARVDLRFERCLGREGCQALAELPPRELSAIELALRAAGWAIPA